MKKHQLNSQYILWAEDDSEDRKMIQQIVYEFYPYARLQLTRGSVEMIEVLKAIEDSAKLPSLVVMDINMPRKSGLETLCYIRNNRQLKHLTAAVFTTSNSKIDQLFCIRHQATMLTKSPDFFEYREAVALILDLCKTEEDERPIII